MTKLISGRVHKVPSANVSAERYQFLEISEAEPDLGLPSELGQVFTSDLNGNRYWSRLDTANVLETTNQYFTNVRVLQAVDPKLNTANVLETTNQYFTNVRVLQAVDPKLTTANVLESTNNLYYTNDRVSSFVTGLSIGDLADVANIYTYPTSNSIIGIQEGQALVWNGNIFIPVFVNSEVANVADLSVKVLSLENQTTANVREAASNLYFTNTRVIDAISLADINPNNINANNIVVDSITANIWNRLYTANVIETSGNLYFTTQRARNSVSNSTGVYYSSDTGIFSIGQDVAVTSDVQFRDLTLTGNLFILGNVAIIAANTLQINDPLIQVGVGNPGDQWDLGLVGHYLDGGQRHAGIIRDATDGKFKFFSNTLVEPGNVNYIDTTEDSFRLASVVATTFEGNVIGTVSSIANHNTDALAEGQNNLYYTNARTVQTVTPILTTSNVVEDTNLYFTNARVLANVEQMSINVLADVDITGVSVNSALVWDGTKFIPGSTEAAIRSNFANTAGSANVALLADRANLVSSLSNHDTANLAEGTNLYYTNSRVLSALVYANVLVADLTAAGNLVANGLIIRGINVNDSVLTGNINITNIAAANVINANVISSQVWQGLYSGNIIESTNLFFSNTRARNAFIAGRGIIIMDDGTIKSTVGTENFNTSINLGQSYTVTSELAPALTIASTPTVDRYLVRSMHLTNISDNPAFVSANVLYATGNTATLANLIPVPVGGIVEFMDRIQVLQPGDKINVQGFDSAGTPTSNILSLNFSIEQISNDATYYGTSFTLASSNVETTLISTPQSYAIIESVKFVNLTGTSVPVRLYTKNSNNVIKSYLAYNTQVPPNSSLEILQSPKTLEFTDTLYASYTNTSANSAIAVFPSYRYSSVTTLGVSTASAIPGDNVIISFTTSVTDGSTLYYTLE